MAVALVAWRGALLPGCCRKAGNAMVALGGGKGGGHAPRACEMRHARQARRHFNQVYASGRWLRAGLVCGGR